MHSTCMDPQEHVQQIIGSNTDTAVNTWHCIPMSRMNSNAVSHTGSTQDKYIVSAYSCSQTELRHHRIYSTSNQDIKGVENSYISI